MLVFPQILTGASTLYPLRKRRISRTVLNELADGSVVKWADPDAAAVVWDISLKRLTRSESDAIEQLFVQVQGASETFTMLDPLGNLLAWSEDFETRVWEKDALIALQSGGDDPFGGNNAVNLLNGSQIAAGVLQRLTIPGDFHYCFSVWVRSTGGGSVTLSIETASVTFAIDPVWRRIHFAANPNVVTTPLAFRVTSLPGASCELFGAQVEAQLAPSAYKRTDAHGGVYPNARFASEEWISVAQSTDVVDMAVQVFSREY